MGRIHILLFSRLPPAAKSFSVFVCVLQEFNFFTTVHIQMKLEIHRWCFSSAEEEGRNMSVAAQPGVMTQDDIHKIREGIEGLFWWKMETSPRFCFPQWINTFNLSPFSWYSLRKILLSNYIICFNVGII